jgi:hypothetical protein
MSLCLENYLRRGTPSSVSPGPVKIENGTRGEKKKRNLSTNNEMKFPPIYHVVKKKKPSHLY